MSSPPRRPWVWALVTVIGLPAFSAASVEAMGPRSAHFSPLANLVISVCCVVAIGLTFLDGSD